MREEIIELDDTALDCEIEHCEAVAGDLHPDLEEGNHEMLAALMAEKSRREMASADLDAEIGRLESVVAGIKGPIRADEDTQRLEELQAERGRRREQNKMATPRRSDFSEAMAQDMVTHASTVSDAARTRGQTSPALGRD